MRAPLRAALLCPVLCGLAGAATTQVWELNSFSDFARGRLQNVSLDHDGRLTAAPALLQLFAPGEAAVWSAVRAADGSTFLATGNRGRIYRVDAAGKGSLYWTAEQPEIFALANHASGALLAGTSPNGAVYRIEAAAKATLLFRPKARFIWSIAPGPDGALYLACGEPAVIYRLGKNGDAELYYDTGQGHVTSLAITGDGALLAGTEPNGILYRISAKDRATVLYHANLPEIRGIAAAPDGTVYAAAMGGSVAKRTGASGSSPSGSPGVIITAPTTTITVTDSQAGAEIKPKVEAPKPATPTGATPAAAPAAATVTAETAGVDKSAIYRIRPDNTVETLWSSKDENVYDLLLRPEGNLLFSTDQSGRIYRLAADRKATLLAQAGEGEVTRFLDTGADLLAAAAEAGRLYRLGNGAAAGGAYESPVHDSNTVARWGRLYGRTGGAIRLSTRTGNTGRPDQTWSPWTALRNSLVQSPNARYIQWRAEFQDPSASLANVSLAYLPQNTPPVVRSISVSAGAPPAAAKTQTAAAAATAAYSITVTDTGDVAAASAPASTQIIPRNGAAQLQITWQAEDPDGDRLSYSIYFRGEDEREWKLMRANLTETTLALDGDALADGRYYFRVVATDRPSNPVQFAREGELVSAPVLIDNTPPAVTAVARRTGAGIEIKVHARDQISALRRAEFSVDAGPWVPVEAVDGVTDSPEEDFEIRIDPFRPGERLIVIRVYDAAGNAGLTKAVIR